MEDEMSNNDSRSNIKIVIGIDPGENTGVAVFQNGVLVHLYTFGSNSYKFLGFSTGNIKVILEDSRLQSHVFIGKGLSVPARLKMARDVGRIDEKCAQIVLLCEEAGVPVLSVSPKQKGAKLNAKQFKLITGWSGKSNQHERDAAMVAWPYRNGR
jgi:hypothetical protein